MTKNSVSTFIDAKHKNEKITMLTAYDYSMAKLIDESGVEGILVGDSLGMVCLGYKDTLAVTMEDMIHHIKAVSRAAHSALVVGDMPFMSYQTSVYDAVKNAGRIVQEGSAGAVKLEGGASVYEKVKAIVNAQIPVMGHIGLTPQSVNMFGGFKVQGKDEIKARNIVEDAKKLEDAGVFSIVLEGIPYKLAKIVTESVSVPTIGIGAGKYCDGQILVYQDMLGLFSDLKPKFVKSYGNAGEVVKKAFKDYISEVKSGIFPDEKYSFKVDDRVLEKLYGGQ
ncbi:3-methyl-2-oxobutanoate hydroxymethyltransferase [Clostridium tyrobutyricum]|jgi:3-methyl-2-oxobutanoate hydroxymethyltransferase|nr:3-methyl-2-oxobutanoate hydroxymethyltransferase [Clostridium tyrobutyricum]ANP69501.1 3-methyl-2-oxobutanoate hydroxymethyltransferase [Clostridium tyrobutyricum]MBR9649152.1 3-methyl-2-oxobutanoate hydroxymethyltransferase [Clostridium tyrobutyricum]MBV4416573.1 3-methyl-2-oxobutanoate hydroxymethyltransferase [Clostridium tyrobutyricum]MBV4422639.1 3-methyl-2-oxobutanoate hydroxymethyltransferase [Clostridium tyrobutyricum]MBV4423732.1 3-methyl-2-oxobutanoate hydroxymethyltransferase [Cl